MRWTTTLILMLKQCKNIFEQNCHIFRTISRQRYDKRVTVKTMAFSFAQTALLVTHPVASNDKRSGICAVYVIPNRLWNERTDVRFVMALSYCLCRSISISLFDEFRAALHAATGPMFVGKYWRRGLAGTKVASIYFNPGSCHLDRKGITE